MARTTNKGRGTGSTTRRTGAKHTASSVVPDIYKDMLADVVSSSPTRLDDEGQTVKRRRVGGRIAATGRQGSPHMQSEMVTEDIGDIEVGSAAAIIRQQDQQTAYIDSTDSAESDMAWEEVELENTLDDRGRGSEPNDLNLVLGGNGDDTVERRAVQKRKPLTAVDRKMRLEIHKMHITSLLVHTSLRNHWCNDHEVQIALRKMLSKKTCSYLSDDETQSQFQRSRSFIAGMEQASEAFRSRYKITARGLSRAFWADNADHLPDSILPNDVDLPMQKSDFRVAATSLKGSRDTGAQLFCALSRSAGVEARLVCSLQVLPFGATIAGNTPVKHKFALTVAYPETRAAISDEESGHNVGSDTSIRSAVSSNANGAVSRIRSKLASRIGRPQQAAQDVPNSTPPPKCTMPIRQESPCPIYWVEAFNSAIQKWVPIDPLVTKTIAKPSRFEPSASDLMNNMTYVIAFEEDGSLRDVTKRYTKAYNAKTRKGRVEVTNGGEVWWSKVLRMYRRTYELDRDQVEDRELTSKEAAERMPKNIQDFKDHPYYALERHLRRSEAIHPKREVGKVNSGRPGAAANKKALESVYRRRDVHTVKSADSWYRLGREIKAAEQPLKRVKSRRKRESDSRLGSSEDEDDAGTAMYAAFQTIVYEAPPVVGGKVPKNVYGNLDVYVPSMVPPGGIHIAHPDAVRAAKLLGVDCSDAVTGFEFKGRHGTAVIKGAVVAAEYQESITEVIRGFANERIEAEKCHRSLEALRLWKKFLTGLRIRKRIRGYEIEGESAIVEDECSYDEESMSDGGGGGFLPDFEDLEVVESTARPFFQRVPDYDDYDEGGGFVDDSSSEPHDQIEISKATLQVNDELSGGGFLADEEENEEEDRQGFEMNTEKSPSGIEPLIKKTFTQPQGNSPKEPSPDFPNEMCRPEDEKTEAKGDSTVDHGLSRHELAKGRMLQKVYENSMSDARNNSKGVGKDAVSQLLPIPASGPEVELQAVHTTEAAPGTPAMEVSKNDRQGDETSKDSSLLQPESELRDVDMLVPPETSANESASDKGSLLSHDPSDDEADPEWLI